MIEALFAGASILSPFLLLRRRALARWFGLYAGAWLLREGVVIVARPLGATIDPHLAAIGFGVCATAAFWAVVAFSNPADLRWSAGRAALAAALFYAVAVPLMLQTPIDGDEPYYLLATESLVRDRDLDLRNQYADLEHSATGRRDLVPQPGDPVGRHGEQYSRHEPFLSLLMIPGYLAGRLPGAVAVIALFAALLARSTIRLFEEEGIDDAVIRAVFPLVAFGPPLVFYAARIWPEVPAAFCFVEAVRGVRQRRPARWVTAMLGMVLLKLRFVLIAVVLLARALRTRRQAVVAAAIVALPLIVLWLVSGSATNVHSMRELIPGPLKFMVLGLFGLLLDGAAGILFQAPIYVFGIIALTRWPRMPPAFRLGMSSTFLYMLYLIPRAEWHGGWSPPLRYVVVFMPLLALGAAALWQRIAPTALIAATAWTIVLVVHGMAYPWRLFHLANGENVVGETLSSVWHSDFSRLFPSFIRPNLAALVASIIAVVAIALFRSGRLFNAALITAALAAAFVYGRKPGSRIEFEDAHVIHQGGELYPTEYQMARFLFRGGWILHAGDSVSFLARAGPSTLQYSAAQPAVIRINAQNYNLAPTGSGYGAVRVDVGGSGRVVLQCISGSVNLDRMDHD